MNRIYLDNFRATRVADEVWDIMREYALEKYAVPAPFIQTGTEAQEAIENAQKVMASKISAKPAEIVFTDSATDSINIVLKGVVYANKRGFNHIITSEIEHPAVLAVFKALEKDGFKADYIKPDKEGFYNLEQLKDFLREDTALVSLTYVNHMIGTIEPIQEAANIVFEYSKKIGRKIPLHIDFATSFTHMPINIDELQVDLASFSSGKIHGPKGVGSLYIRKDVKILPVQFGADSYSQIKPGTPNVMGIVGFSKAIELGFEDFEQKTLYIKNLRDYLMDGIQKNIPHILLNGPSKEKRGISHICYSFLFIEGEAIMMFLDLDGISVDTGSACASATLKPNYVLVAIGRNHEESHGSLRFTLSRYNTFKELDIVLDKLTQIVKRLRDQSTIRP